jgi:D-methionine transport system permease protein
MSGLMENIDWSEIGQATLDTLSMLGGSMVLTVVLGLPLGVILFLTGPGQMLGNRVANGVLSLVINILRSVPFVILLIVMIPLTVALVGTSLGVAGRFRRWWSGPRRSSPGWWRRPCARSTRA